MQRSRHSKNWIRHGLAALLWTAASVAQAGIITQWTTTGSSAPASGPRAFSSGGEILRAWAYSTEYESGAGVFNPAKLGLYSGGLGVKNNYADDNVSGDSKREAVAPYHAVDNHRHVDLVIFEFADDHYRPLSFEIGYKSKDADILVWFGGAALGPGYDFSGQSFTTLTSLGFSDFWSFTNVPVNTPQLLTGAGHGRYLVIAAAPKTSAKDLDAFKISRVTAELPEPGTWALVGVALAALFLLGSAAKKQKLTNQ